MGLIVNKLEVFDNFIEDAPVDEEDEVIDLDHTTEALEIIIEYVGNKAPYS